MKILAVIGSPRGKSSGYKVTHQVEKEMKELGDVDFDYLLLKDADLKLCRGCFLCISRGEGFCPLEDDMGKIEEKIINSDGVILVSPGYAYNVSWLMKNFIDRFAYTNHRPRFFEQKVMLIANSGGSGLKETIEALRMTFGVGPEIAAELTYMTPPWPLADEAVAKQQKKVKEEANKFYQSLKRKEKPVPSLNDYIRFKFFKNVSSDVKEYLPADYEYYKEKTGYYYETQISIFKKVAAWFMLKLGSFMMRDLAPKGSK